MKEEEMNLRQANQTGMPDDIEQQSLSFLESEGLKLLADFQRIADAKVRNTVAQLVQDIADAAEHK